MPIDRRAQWTANRTYVHVSVLSVDVVVVVSVSSLLPSLMRTLVIKVKTVISSTWCKGQCINLIESG